MPFTLDMHIHSKYSRATSKHMDPDHIFQWGQYKGIEVIGTGDFTHPAWFAELREKLEPAEEGLFKLKDCYAAEMIQQVPQACRNDMRFMLTVEISNIYKKGDRTRKIHNLICAPSFEVAAKIIRELGAIGNIQSDGRPILGLSSKDLFQIVLDASDTCMFIPAHVWTPHFAVFGSKSGYDSLEECFDELTPHISALETGLSSDPVMNHRWSAIDGFTLVSNSDAHSPGKLGREANRLETERSFPAIKDAIVDGDPSRFLETLEFYPEEGKYHYDGHRLCQVRCTPGETRAHEGKCPTCGKPLTVGVLNRIETLADRPESFRKPSAIPFRYLIPLPEILSDLLDVGSGSQKVARAYFKMLSRLGNEFSILLDVPLEEIERAESPMVAEAIRRVREGRVHIEPGYDGEFGRIRVFTAEEKESFSPQLSLFG